MSVAGEKDRFPLGHQYLNEAGYGGGLTSAGHTKDQCIILSRNDLRVNGVSDSMKINNSSYVPL